MGEEVASIINRLLCKLNFCSDFYNFDYFLEGSLKNQAEVLGLQQCTEQMRHPSIHSSSHCVVHGN